MGKKVIKVLKGVAITGSAATGISVLTDANLAYAQSLEEEIVEQTLEETVLETEVEAQTELDQYNTYTYETVESAEAAISEAETEIAEAEEERAVAVAEEESVQQELQSAIEEQTSVQSELDTAITEKAALEEEMAAKEQAYQEEGYANEGLDEQQTVIEEKILEETAVREQLDEANKDLTLDNYYKNEGRALAKEMILYKLLLTGEVSAEDADKVFFGENFNHDYVGKHYCVKYVKMVDGEPVYVERYFDYVTCDEEGNSLYQGLVENENDSSIVDGINVVEKTPTYKVWTEDPHKVSTYEKNVPGKIKNQTVFGYTFHAAQRDEQAGWYAEEGQQKKGVDWYTKKQYQQDKANREEYKEYVEVVTAAVSTLDEKIAQLTTTISNITNRIADLRDDLEDIQVVVEGYDNTIDYLKGKVDALTGRIQEIVAGQQTQNNEIAQNTTTPVASASRTATTLASSVAVEEAQVLAATVVQSAEQTPAPAMAAPTRQVVIQSMQDVQVPLVVMNVEPEEDLTETVTISEQSIAKSSEVTKSMAVWNGATLPLLGTIAGLVAFKKSRSQEN